MKDASASTYTVIGTGDPTEEKDKMEFRLLYSGELKGASRNNTRPDMKHDIRRSFHPQLRRLWNTNRSLGQLAANRNVKIWMDKHPEIEGYRLADKDLRRQAGLETISYNWERNGYNFIPLVTKAFVLRCKIDILFLRPEEDSYVMQGGDLDGRLKTVFDALRLPANLQEAGGIGPQEDETPFFCLLEDDKLISDVSVTTDQLLVLPKERNIKPNDAFLVIHVTLNQSNPATTDNYFG